MQPDADKLGISGRIARTFLTSEITLLLVLVALLLGGLAVMITPREEEPQINVTFANIFIAFPGATAEEVEQIVTTPAEQVLSEIDGIKHVYSTSRPGLSILTVRYKVGENRIDAIVRLYDAMFSNQDWLPANLGVQQPIIKPKGIDDVPIVTLTLWSEKSRFGSYELQQVAHALEAELKRIPGTRDIYTVGSSRRVVRVEIDASRAAGHGISLENLRSAIQGANSSYKSGVLVRDNREVPVQAGSFLASSEDLREIVVGVYKGSPVYLGDIANVIDGPETAKSFVTHVHKGHSAEMQADYSHPAVTLAIAKKPGTNAVDIANQLMTRLEQLKGIIIPDHVNITVTRNYGATADTKAKTLITKLIFATASVILLVLFAMKNPAGLGWSEAMVVGTAVITTLMLTLFASWAWGFTLNRVSLFALIFSIGILVDDAIVVVENIHRHMSLGERDLIKTIPKAVDEVGGPTILATFTVIAALLPMTFVSGLMGPYMSPIPINASMGMLISLAVAFIVTPWLSNLLFARKKYHASGEESTTLVDLFNRIMAPLLDDNKGRQRRNKLWVGVLFLLFMSVSLVFFKAVVFKMLPFDNKSEFQIIVDMPEGTTLEQTQRVLKDLGRMLLDVPEVENYQIYAGTASPINFNGLIRQYYLRSGSHQGDIQVNLVDKSQRDRASHEIALSVREVIQERASHYSAAVKVVEVPPGPPVFSPLVVEIYGMDYDNQSRLAGSVREHLEMTDGVVDVDDSVEDLSLRYIVRIDRQRAALFGIDQNTISRLIATSLQGEDIGYLHGAHVKYPVPIRLILPVSQRDDMDTVLNMKVRANSGEMVAIRDLVTIQESLQEKAIHHKDLSPVVYVTGNMAGRLDSPLYGMFSAAASIRDDPSLQGVKQQFISSPDNPHQSVLKWDGEWQVTYETFRDMGIAYSVGLLLIYFLVVAQFRSYLVPLVIMVPIPLTLIGVMPGHALFGVQFTATSMIGMIALAGIIVRNSILLVDFINKEYNRGMPFKQAVIRSGAVRARPIVLTGLAAMMGAFFILNDPIFGGLAVSLISGILVSTILTLVIIPVLYYATMKERIIRDEI